MHDKFTCPKCGGDAHLERRGTQTALVCGSCGAWLKWVGKKEKEEFLRASRTDDAKASDVVYLVCFGTGDGPVPEKAFKTEKAADEWILDQKYPQDYFVVDMKMEG